MVPHSLTVILDSEISGNVLLMLSELPRSMCLDTMTLLLNELELVVGRSEWEKREEMDLWILECAEAMERLDTDPAKALELLKWVKTSRLGAHNFTPMMQVAHLITLSEEKIYHASETHALIQLRIDQLTDIVALDREHDFYVRLDDYERFSPSMIGIHLYLTIQRCP